jgi:hypothetical protein
MTDEVRHPQSRVIVASDAATRAVPTRRATMTFGKRVTAISLAAVLTLTGVACGGDDSGEDTIGDGEVNDEGD